VCQFIIPVEAQLISGIPNDAHGPERSGSTKRWHYADRSIFRVAYVVVRLNRQSATQQFGAQSKIQLLVQFPLQVRKVVGSLSSTEHHVVQCSRDRVRSIGTITGRDLIVTQLTPACAQLQEVDRSNSVHKRFFGYYPTQSNRGEVPPCLLVFVRAVGPHGSIYQVPIVEVIGNTGKIGYTVLPDSIVCSVVNINGTRLVEVPGLFVEVYELTSASPEHFKGFIPEGRSEHHGQIVHTEGLVVREHVVPDLIYPGFGFLCERRIRPVEVVSYKIRKIHLPLIEKSRGRVVGRLKRKLVGNQLQVDIEIGQ